MSNPVDIDQIEREARRAAEAKVAAVRSLARARQAHLTAAATLEAAESADIAAYLAAVGHGWTPVELRQFGFDEPGTDDFRSSISTNESTAAAAQADDAPGLTDSVGYLSSVAQ